MTKSTNWVVYNNRNIVSQSWRPEAGNQAVSGFGSSEGLCRRTWLPAALQPLGAGNSPWPSLACGHITVISVTTRLSHKHTGHAERLLLNHANTPGFLAPGGEEFNPGPETRLDRSELLCNKVLLKYKGDRESF